MNFMVISNPNSWYNNSLKIKSQSVFIKELIMSPIDIQISFKTTMKGDTDILSDEKGSKLVM